jgi:Xaa-Pro aminopeptidase
MSHAKEGASGRELTEVLISEVVRGGCLFKSQMYPTLAIGRKSYLQDVVHPAREKLTKGDLIRFDGGGAFRFYSSDIARNAVLGRASMQQRRYYDAVLAGEQAIIDHARPGVKASELYRISIETIRKGVIPDFRRAHCGHSIGVDTYDGVMISPTDDTTIESGMVLNPETPYDEFGLGKFHVEDPVLVTSKGARLLTKGHRNLLEV